MINLPQQGTQFWYISALGTKIVILYLGKFPRRKHHLLLCFEHARMLWVIWLTNEQLAAPLTQVMAADDPDRLSDAAVEAAQAAFQHGTRIRAPVDAVRALTAISSAPKRLGPPLRQGSAAVTTYARESRRA